MADEGAKFYLWLESVFNDKGTKEAVASLKNVEKSADNTQKATKQGGGLLEGLDKS